MINSEPLALRLAGVGKQYSRKEVSVATWRQEWNRTGQHLLRNEIFWALHEINFNVCRGEVIGIIGRNGAGKSTLLKLLSQITLPSAGTIWIKGKIASLLEVGTGMHPDLTGRENILLNAALLGMSKQRIASRFDAIVEFSECQNFIDTPIKRYSTGMKVKLGFSVAAFLDPDILILDEVLAVGDSHFQAKAFEKVKDLVRHKEKTVLYVSHNMTSIKTLCQRCIVLEDGKLLHDGDVDTAIAKYLGYNISLTSRFREWSLHEAPGNEQVKLLLAKIFGKNQSMEERLNTADVLEVELVLWRKDVTKRFDCTLQLFSEDHAFLAAISTLQMPDSFFRQDSHEVSYKVKIPSNIFNQRRYRINLLVLQNRRSVCERFDNVLGLEFTTAAQDDNAWMGDAKSHFLPHLPWKVN